MIVMLERLFTLVRIKGKISWMKIRLSKLEVINALVEFKLKSQLPEWDSNVTRKETECHQNWSKNKEGRIIFQKIFSNKK